jgi:uncharacterized membrane protein
MGGTSDCPDRPRKETREQLEFEPRPMVRWLDPRELADAALRVVLSSVFGTYADKREELVTRDETIFDRYAQRDSIWLDFVADVGDGFDSTYAVATALARETLPAGETVTERGSVLVMGGDQVYPTAERREYEDRTIGPYRAALPCTEPGCEPDLYAIPGNHDWYDGLTSYLRIFGRQTWVGGWCTKQRRSYFALELPQRWWLWAIDIQFDTYIDDAQLDYFAKARERLRGGDRVILVTGKPSWVTAGRGCTPKDAERRADSYRNLAYFEEKLIRPSRASLAVTISGDLHHYSRYESAEGAQKITSGGGGAYLYPTHHLPSRISLGGHKGAHREEYECKAVWPPRKQSRGLRWGALKLPLGTPALSLLVGVLHALLGLAIFNAVKDGAGGVAASARGQGVGELIGDAVSVSSVLLALVFAAALVLFAAAPGRLLRGSVGIAHALVHVALAGAVALGTIELLSDAWPDAPQWAQAGSVALACLAAGFLVGTFVLALYIVLADIAFGKDCEQNANYVLAAQSIPDWKNFLRLRIGSDGALTIFPFGIEKVPRRWRLEPEGKPEDPWFVPADGEPAVEPKLIETPIVIR